MLASSKTQLRTQVYFAQPWFKLAVRACHENVHATRYKTQQGTVEATRGSNRFLLCASMPQCVHAKIQNTARAVEATRGSTLLLFSFRFAFKAGKSVSVAQCECTGQERALSKTTDTTAYYSALLRPTLPYSYVLKFSPASFRKLSGRLAQPWHICTIKCKLRRKVPRTLWSRETVLVCSQRFRQV